MAADFDGDGKLDRGRLLVDVSRTRYALFVTTTRQGRIRHDKIDEAPATELARSGVAVVAPGTYATACGKGAGRGPCPVGSVQLRQPGVSYFTFEAGAAYAWWTGDGWATAQIAD